MDSQKYCTQCGKELNIGEKFCRKCGKPQGSGKASVQHDSNPSAAVASSSSHQTKQGVIAIYTEANVQAENKHYDRSLELVEKLVLDGSTGRELSQKQYVEILMFFRKLNYKTGRDVAARLTEGEIINNLFGREVEMLEYDTLDPEEAQDPLLAEMVLREIIDTHPGKNSFYYAQRYSSSKKPMVSGAAEQSTSTETSNQVVTTKPERKRGTHLKSIIYIAVVVLAIASYALSDYLTVAYYWQSSSDEIKRIADNSGFSIKGKAVFLATHPEVVGPDQLKTSCRREDSNILEYGCYLTSDNKIFLLQSPDKEFEEIEYTAAAHETLHAVWQKLDSSSRSELARKILALYSDSNNPDHAPLSADMEPYPKDDTTVVTELYSFIGSTHPNLLTDEYSGYLDDRDAPSNANLTFNTSIKSRSDSLESRRTQLESSLADINQFKIRYVDSFVNRYGTVDAYQYDNYTHNFDILKQKTNTWEQQRVQFNADLESFNRLRKGFYPSDATIQSL